jgi:hypothetical protein
MSLLAVIVVVAPTADAQVEPTPVPEPEAPAATPEEPETPAEPEEPGPVADAEPAVAAIPKVFREKTQIEIKGRSEVKGAIELIVQVQGEEPTKVRVNVLAKDKAKPITADLAKEITFAVDDRYAVKLSGTKIVVKTKKKNPPISITVSTQSLSGVSVMISNG